MKKNKIILIIRQKKSTWEILRPLAFSQESFHFYQKKKRKKESFHCRPPRPKENLTRARYIIRTKKTLHHLSKHSMNSNYYNFSCYCNGRWSTASKRDVGKTDWYPRQGANPELFIYLFDNLIKQAGTQNRACRSAHVFLIITRHLSLYSTHLRNFRYLFLVTISQSPRIYYVLKFCILLSFISSLSHKFPTRPHILLNENSNHLST